MKADWSAKLRSLITSEGHFAALDADDQSVLATLIVLCRAVEGEFSLTDLTSVCIAFDEMHAAKEVS